jgi:hypothetical protein
LSLFLSLIGLLSIGILVYQTRQSSRALESTAHQTIHGQALDVDKLFIENSSLRPYFDSGKELGERDPNRDKVLALADLQIDFFASFWRQTDNIPALQHDTAEWRAWKNYIQSTFAASPVMRKRLAGTKDWYTPDFVCFALATCPSK